MSRILLLAAIAASATLAQRGGGGGANAPLGSLKSVRPPVPSGIEQYVKDNVALVALGKALFWDAQVGSDGRTACATCHFHAGADHRMQNQLSGAAATANSTLSLNDFPFHRLANSGDNRSAVLRDARQVAGSAGVVERSFLSILTGSAFEESAVLSTGSTAGGLQTRRVTGRNTPSVINAVFKSATFGMAARATSSQGRLRLGNPTVG